LKHSNRIPEVGASLPKRGNRLSRALGRSAFSAIGWKFSGEFPDLAKAVLIVVPHTSNWDFLVGISAVFALGIAKESIFRWPLGVLMRWLGGIAIDRRASHGAVAQVAERFTAADKLLLGLSPEGTRSKVNRWKTGFYYIAHEAGVPIVPIAFDYSCKEIRLGHPLQPSGSVEEDFAILEAFFSGATGKRPASAQAVGAFAHADE